MSGPSKSGGLLSRLQHGSSGASGAGAALMRPAAAAKAPSLMDDLCQSLDKAAPSHPQPALAAPLAALNNSRQAACPHSNHAYCLIRHAITLATCSAHLVPAANNANSIVLHVLDASVVWQQAQPRQQAEDELCSSFRQPH